MCHVACNESFVRVNGLYIFVEISLTSWCVVFRVLAWSARPEYLHLMCISLECIQAAGGASRPNTWPANQHKNQLPVLDAVLQSYYHQKLPKIQSKIVFSSLETSPSVEFLFVFFLTSHLMEFVADS